MTALVAGGLLVLAVLDGAFSGFRASAGRTGLIDHRAADWIGAGRGVALALLLLAPVIAGVSADVAARPERAATYARAGSAMLALYGAYGVAVLVALACYLTLSWRHRYLAAAMLLGPFTLARPALACLGSALAAIVGDDAVTAAFAIAAVAGVLAVEPAAGRVWYRVTCAPGGSRRRALPARCRRCPARWGPGGARSRR